MKYRFQHLLYILILTFITLSGFAQMPIFKRYYIADIPGLGWLAENYVTHRLHYIMVLLLLALGSYAVTSLILNGRGWLSCLALWGRIKAILILGLIVSGGTMVVRNLPGIYFPHTAIHVMDLVHIGLCIILLAVSAYTLAARKPWTN